MPPVNRTNNIVTAHISQRSRRGNRECRPVEIRQEPVGSGPLVRVIDKRIAENLVRPLVADAGQRYIGSCRDGKNTGRISRCKSPRTLQSDAILFSVAFENVRCRMRLHSC